MALDLDFVRGSGNRIRTDDLRHRITPLVAVGARVLRFARDNARRIRSCV
jgi:hypothetical protein